MTDPVQCPACYAMNKPGQTRCRVCGRRLRPEKGVSTDAPPVVLQKVMGGEVFSAVLGDAGAPPSSGPASADEAPAEPTAAPVPTDAEEAARRALAVLTERLAGRASSEGQRFKPYAPDRPRIPQTAEAQVAVRRQLDSAARAFREKRYENAVEHLLKAIAKDDQDPRSWILLGQAYLRVDRPYKAAVGYVRALDLQPRSESAWLGLARTLKAIGDLPGAREVLDRIVLVSPSLAEAWSERGLVLESLAELPEAAKSYAHALELRPDHRPARERLDAIAPLLSEPGPPETPGEPGGKGDESPAATPEAAEAEEDFPDFADLAQLPPKAERGEALAPVQAPHPSRIRTYVDGLDDTLGGGIPWGHVVLVEGSPGTMKSSVAFAILLQNAVREGRHCLYFSLEERTSSILKQMGSLGLPLHVSQGSLVVLDPRAAKGLLKDHADWVEAFQHALASIKHERGLDLLVIDSLDALEVLAKFKDRRREIFRLFEWLRDLDITCFVITERPDWVIGGHVVQGRWDEDFLADGVLHLRQHLVSDLEVQRRLRVVKMRGTRHDTGYLALVLDEGRFKVTRAMSP